MPKETGINARMFYAGYDLSGDIGAVQSINKTQELDNVTGLDKDAMERIGLVSDGEISFANFFNAETAAGAEGAHTVLKTLTGDKHICYAHRPTRGAPGACMIAKQATYNVERGDNGSLRGSVQAMNSSGYGLEWGRLLSAGAEVITTGTPLASVDNSASSSGGWAAYLQVIDVTGTNVIMTLQESSDDGAGDAFANVTGGAFASVTADHTSERISGTGALERYVRIDPSGTFTSVTFVLTLVRF